MPHFQLTMICGYSHFLCVVEERFEVSEAESNATHDALSRVPSEEHSVGSFSCTHQQEQLGLGEVLGFVNVHLKV